MARPITSHGSRKRSQPHSLQDAEMSDNTPASAAAADNLHVIIDLVLEGLKTTTPAVEELHKAAVKYQAAMEAANTAAAGFLDAFQKVAVGASKTHGETQRLGFAMQTLASQHEQILTERVRQAEKMSLQFVSPLGKRLKAESRTLAKLEEDFKAGTKQHKGDLKKAGAGTVKAQKHASKKGDQDQVIKALISLTHKSKVYEAFTQRTLRDALIEERRRYCYLVDNWASVFDLDFSTADRRKSLKAAIELVRRPEELPRENEEMIARKSSSGLMYDAPPLHEIEHEFVNKGRLVPSAITQEVNSKFVPPGAPPGGLNADFTPSSDQINPRSAAFQDGYLNFVMAERQHMRRELEDK